MKLKTRLIIAFVTVIAFPILLGALFIFMLGQYQLSMIEKNYELKGTTVESFSNPTKLMGQLTEKSFHELAEMARSNPRNLEDATWLEQFNASLEQKKSYLLVRKDDTIVYLGNSDARVDAIIDQLPGYGEMDTASENGIYLGGDAQVLIKQVDFRYEDESEGSIFIVTDVGAVIPEIRQFTVDIALVIVMVLVLTASILIWWIYRSVKQPLAKMQVAAKNIKEGNLDFELCADADDEFGQLCKDFEDMRKRLKDSAEENMKFDKESKELISNISHDLKTPITAVKGYVEGLLDGVADTPEKQKKYLRTIYNKANDMDRLINELTFYSKIDTNRIPYTFNKINVKEYFDDCFEDIGMEMSQQQISLSYDNKVAPDVMVIADAEQIKRVINNIVGNSVKYMDKPDKSIAIRVMDVGDFVQVEIEDNGRGIAAKDLPYIFDRFYRTDTSRNSSKGGSGIGLSIVHKVMEDHGGKVWATSREGEGTTMYFVLRKYQEVPANE